MADDIFSDNNEPLDTSDIDDRWEPDTDGPELTVAEHDADFDEVEDDADDADDLGDVSDDADEDAGDDGEDDGDDADVDAAPAADPADDILSHELVKGKSPEQLAKMLVDNHAMIGRQSNEVSELRRMTTEQADQIKELIGYLQQAPQQQPYEQVDTSSIVANALDNPRGAYKDAVSLIDQGLATPDLVDDIIEAVEDLSPKLARQMTADFTARMVTAQLRNEFKTELETKVAPLAQNDYQSQLTLATTSLYNDPVLGEDAKAYEAEVVAMLAEKDENGKIKPIGKSAQEIRAKLESALTVARGQDPTKSAAYRKALVQLKSDAQTEGGNPPGKSAPKKSEADEYRAARFARAKERDPGAALFG